MANKVFPQFLLRRFTGVSTEDLSAAGVNLKIVALDLASYTYSDAHEFLSDIPAPARIATTGNLANKTVTRVGDDIMLDADDLDLTFGASPPSIEALVVYIDTGTASTSRLIRFTDTASYLPFTPATSETRQIRFDALGWMRINNP